jgi:hypothetical protein
MDLRHKPARALRGTRSPPTFVDSRLTTVIARLVDKQFRINENYMRNLVVVLVGVWLVGCNAHVALQAPRTDAPLEERTKAYEQLKPLSAHERVLVTVQGGTATALASTPSYLQLNSGERVYYPEDLVPVLPTNSIAAKAALQSESARTTSSLIQGVGYGLAVVAAAVGLGLYVGAPEVPYPFTTEQLNARQSATTLALGVLIGGASLGGLVALIGNWVFGGTVTDAARTAFETYDSGLRARLMLSSDGTTTKSE